MEIIGIKLQNGDELIAKIEQAVEVSNMRAEDFFNQSPVQNSQNVIGDVVKLNRPYLLHLQQTPKGISLALSPWLLAAKEPTVSINLKQQAVCIFAPDDAVQKAYLEQTSSITLLS